MKYGVHYSGTYIDGEQFSDGGDFTDTLTACKKHAKWMEKNFAEHIRGPNDRRIKDLSAWVQDERGRVVWGL